MSKSKIKANTQTINIYNIVENSKIPEYDSARCNATTLKGKKCKNLIAAGNIKYCSVHSSSKNKANKLNTYPLFDPPIFHQPIFKKKYDIYDLMLAQSMAKEIGKSIGETINREDEKNFQETMPSLDKEKMEAIKKGVIQTKNNLQEDIERMSNGDLEKKMNY